MTGVRVRPEQGDFHGRPTIRIESGHLWLEALAAGGPRVVRLGLAGREANLFAELPGAGWDTPTGRYELLGGHRLWFAPETLVPGVPDAEGLAHEPIDGGIRLTGRREQTGLRRTIEVELAPEAASLTVRHRIANEGERTFTLAVWGITQLPLGGVALVPQPPRRPEPAIVPNRNVVLWPYASWQDRRLMLADGLLAVDAQPDHAQKVGCLSESGVAAYLRERVLFVKRFEPALDRPHADFGCNVEIYCDESSIELETLGPIVELPPGGAAEHDEHWEVYDTTEAAAGGPAEALTALVERLGLG